MIFEITMRGFFTNDRDGIHATPALTLTMSRDGDKTAEGTFDVGPIAKKLAGMVDRVPGGGFRPMTKAEVDDYLADEKEEEA